MKPLCHFVVMLALSNSVSLGDSLSDQLSAGLMSTDRDARLNAAAELISSRNDTIAALLAIVQSPIEPGESFYDPATTRNIAIDLLGRLKAEEAIETLITNALPRRGQDTTLDNLQMKPPALNALVEIGCPALRYLENRETSKMVASEKERESVSYILKELNRGIGRKEDTVEEK